MTEIRGVEYSEEFLSLIKAGNRIRFLTDTKLAHIIALLEEDMVVYKYWKYHRWIWEVKWMHSLSIQYRYHKKELI